MSHTPSYQLTRYPIGSLAELWTISWPLMVGLLSGSVMMFADRLVLARYSTDALTASATAGQAFWVFTVIPLITAAISEIFVGRNHGSGHLQLVGKPVWQMLWLSVATTPLFLLGAYIAPNLLFATADNGILEIAYFRTLLYFGPAFCSTVALMGFFVGIGQVRFVTLSAILGNIFNIGLNIPLIFGYGSIPALGIQGAALATGLSQIIQTFFLLILFLKKEYRMLYNTTDWHFDKYYFMESIAVGAPAGLGRFLETIAHFVFFRIVALSGSENLTTITIAQSLYLLLVFMVEGLSKGVSSITANLLGGKQFALINRVLRSGMLLHSIFFAILICSLILFSHNLLSLFFADSDALLLQDPSFVTMTLRSFMWMGLYFLLDGFAWVYMGFLTAAGDTKFLLYAGILLNWLAYILPAYILLVIFKGSAAQGWMLLSLYIFITFITFLWRYRSKRWLRAFEDSQVLR